MSPLVVALLVLLVVSISSFLHIYVLYPVLLYLVSRFRSPPATRPPDAPLPTVSLIIAAYNEEDVIADKIENSLALDYPDEKLHIVVFSDASTDDTDDIVNSYADTGVELVRIEGRVGKTECQNRVADMVDSEILVFSDANSMYEPDAIRRLVARFVDNVGCVVGEIRHTRSTDDVSGELLFEAYKRLVKRLESRVDSAVKGNGAIYAVRREDYVPLPADSISDFEELLAIKKRAGEIKYAPDAVARERTAGSVEAECTRKIRIATRSWHTIRRHLKLLNPFEYGFYSFALFTNTILWWSTPALLVAALVSALGLFVLTGHVLFALVVAGYAVVVLLGVAGRYLDRKQKTVPNVFHVPYYFLIGNYSLVVGAANFLSGRNIVAWETMND